MFYKIGILFCIFRYFTQKHDENTLAITFFSAVIWDLFWVKYGFWFDKI